MTKSSRPDGRSVLNEDIGRLSVASVPAHTEYHMTRIRLLKGESTSDLASSQHSNNTQWSKLSSSVLLVSETTLPPSQSHMPQVESANLWLFSSKRTPELPR